MPIYEYECEQCRHVTESLRKMADADAPLTCECCGSEKTRRAHSVFAAGGHAADPSCGTCGSPNPAPR